MSAVRPVYAAYPDGGDLPEEGGMRITVIGTGYLGAVHAACMAEIGHDVLGVDTDSQKITALRDGQAPFYEPGLEEILLRAVGSGKLQFSTSLSDAAQF